MRAPAINGVSIVPVTGNKVPAAVGMPTCPSQKEIKSQEKDEDDNARYTRKN